MTPQKQQLEQHVEDRDLVSIYRTGIDDSQIQGFVLAVSSELVLIQYVYDFRLDGLMALRTEDITQVELTATNSLQKKLIFEEGLGAQVPFSFEFDVRSWRTLIAQLTLRHALMIVECEAGEINEFLIGRVVQTEGDSLQIEHFTGAANWAGSPSLVSYRDITCCQVGNNYANVYQRHFERLASALH